MIDPAGDARQPGRTIGDSLERAVSYTIAQALKEQLQKSLACTVILTRSPGETVAPLQNATFANRMAVDLFLSIHCYHAPQNKHEVALYYQSRGESLMPAVQELSLIPAQKAHWKNAKKSRDYANAIAINLQKETVHKFRVDSPLGIPIAPLYGITSAAIALEINCLDPRHVTIYIDPLTNAITSALSHE